MCGCGALFALRVKHARKIENVEANIKSPERSNPILTLETAHCTAASSPNAPQLLYCSFAQPAPGGTGCVASPAATHYKYRPTEASFFDSRPCSRSVLSRRFSPLSHSILSVVHNNQQLGQDAGSFCCEIAVHALMCLSMTDMCRASGVAASLVLGNCQLRNSVPPHIKIGCTPQFGTGWYHPFPKIEHTHSNCTVRCDAAHYICIEVAWTGSGAAGTFTRLRLFLCVHSIYCLLFCSVLPFCRWPVFEIQRLSPL